VSDMATFVAVTQECIEAALRGIAEAFELNENRTYTGLEVAALIRETAKVPVVRQEDFQ
jgi:hypothetical protein